MNDLGPIELRYNQPHVQILWRGWFGDGEYQFGLDHFGCGLRVWIGEASQDQCGIGESCPTGIRIIFNYLDLAEGEACPE